MVELEYRQQQDTEGKLQLHLSQIDGTGSGYWLDSILLMLLLPDSLGLK